MELYCDSTLSRNEIIDGRGEDYIVPFVHFHMPGSLYVELSDPLKFQFVQYELFRTYLFRTCSRSL